MTDLDKQAFAQTVARLAIALREPPLDVVQMQVYFLALRDREFEFLAAAAEQLMIGAKWFPKTSEWRAAALKIEADRIEAQRVLLRKLPTPLCAVCRDSGWVQTPSAVAVKIWKRRDANGHIVDVPHAESTPSRRCACIAERRLEVLGRRPWPALPAAEPPALGMDAATSPDDEITLTREIERETGRRVVPRAMPKVPLYMATGSDE